MRARGILLLTGAAAMMQPPIAAEARILSVSSCGGGMQRMMLPGDPADPGGRRGCAKACHAVAERRGKADGAKKNCC